MFLNPLQSKNGCRLYPTAESCVSAGCAIGAPELALTGVSSLDGVQGVYVLNYCLLKKELRLLLSFMQGSNIFPMS